MTVDELVEILLYKAPQNYTVVMPDYAPIQQVYRDDKYGNGVIILTDYEEEEEL